MISQRSNWRRLSKKNRRPDRQQPSGGCKGLPASLTTPDSPKPQLRPDDSNCFGRW